MSNDYLLVPMQLNAMVLNREAELATPFLRFSTEYAALRSFGDAEPPFPSASTTPPAAGVYLHWTLPKALRRGVYDEDSETATFPYAPNRWLVVRVMFGASAGEAVKAWVLESDFLDESAGSSPFVDPYQLDGSGLPTPMTIGRALRFTPDLSSLPSQPRPFLRAVGPGSATFAAFSPNVQNVFAFTDALLANDDRSQIEQGEFTYHVVGWYSDAVIDPLSGTSWTANGDVAGTYTNDTLDWYVYSDTASLPTSTLVHAMVPAISWSLGGDNPVPENYPLQDVATRVKVAVGNSAVDSLSAIVRLFASGDKAARAAQADLLEAFQYGLLEQLDQPGSAEALNVAIRQHWYGASSGGTLWRIAAEERQDRALPALPPPVVTLAEATLLAELNSEQRELDRQQRILESMQSTLYRLWWKYNWQQWNSLPLSDPDGSISAWVSMQLQHQTGEDVTCSDPGGTDSSGESWYACKVQAQQNLVSALAASAGSVKARLQSLVEANRQVLKAVNRPQYYFPNDPVLLATGLGRATNFDPRGSLLCRLASQTVDVLTVAGTRYCAGGSGGTDVAGKLPVLDDENGLLPEGVQALHAESLFLSPSLFAKDVLGDVTQAPAVQTAIDGLPAPAPGGRFAPQEFARGAWQQPWVPLILDWQVAVLEGPAYTSEAGEPTATFDPSRNWQFDGTDFQWVGPTAASGEDFNEATTQMILQGRTFISPSLVFTLADQIDQYVRAHQLRDPNLEALLQDLDQYIDGIRNQDILSQRLSGLLGMTVERAPTQTVAPTGDIASLVGDARHGVPKPYPDQVAAPAWDFSPMGGTFFVLQKLTVIDTFGRTIDLMRSNYNNSPETRATPEFGFYPIPGWNMRSPTGVMPGPGVGESSDPTQRMLALPPRMVQDARLSFVLMSNDAQNSEVEMVAGANPVCGWIVPNHLDRGLAVYAPDGTAWGELYLSLRARDRYVPVWQPDPTDPQALQSVSDIPNLYVRSMLEALWGRSDAGAGFSALLLAIDRTLWSVNPQGRRKDQNLSMLVGRPLAVVRARLSLKLRGLAYTNQDWWNTFDVDLGGTLPDPMKPAPLASVDGGVFDSTWPLRLGSRALRDDGLIGYFLDNPGAPNATYQVFNAVMAPREAPTDYVRQIGEDSNFLRLRFTDDNVTSLDSEKNQVCDVTMLVDPRGGVHAFSGLLPVVRLDVPGEFVTPALRTMAYTFRAGPFLTLPDAVRVPLPAERKGTWAWFDRVLGAAVPISPADQNVRLSRTPALVKEGWLKLTPNPSQDPDDGGTVS